MKFRIVDLLALTTVAVVYAAMLSQVPLSTLPIWDSLQPLSPLLPILAVQVVYHFASMVWNRRNRGSLLLAWRPPNWRWTHIRLFAIFALVWVIAISPRRPGPVLLVLLILPWMHLPLLAQRQYSVHEGGINNGLSLLQWNDYWFQVDRASARLKWRIKPGWKRALFAWSGSVSIPIDLVDRVATVVDERQVW